MGRFGTLFFLLCLIFSFFSCTVEETEFKRRLTVVACGDVLFYDGNYRHFAENGSVEDFYRVTEPVADSVRSADVAIVNQEAMTAGREFGVSGYPFFNAPFELTEALRKTGFDVFATANNHSLDRGRAGIDAAVGYYRKTGALHVGTAAGNDDPLRPLILLVKDVSIAVFSLTDITNICYPDPSPVADTRNRPLIRERISKAAAECDFVLVMLHYGDEYTLAPRENDRDLVCFLIDVGADVVFGNHAHVIRAFEIFSSPKGGEAFVFWGLGNFVGWMGHRPECSVGGIFRVTLTVSETKEGVRVRKVAEPSVELTYSVNEEQLHRTVFLRDAEPYCPDSRSLFDSVSGLLKSIDSRVDVF